MCSYCRCYISCAVRYHQRVSANSHILYSHGTLCMIAFLLKVCFHIYLRQFKISFSWTYFFASNLTFLIYLYSNTFRLVLNHLLQSISPFTFHIGRTLLIFISYVPFIYLNPVFQGSTTETILLVIVLPISCFSWINM